MSRIHPRAGVEVLYDDASQVRGFVTNGETVSFGLDGLGRAMTVSDSLGERGFLTTETDKAARTSVYTYDDTGRVLTETTRSGEILAFSYDIAGRLESVTGADAWVAYDYDPLGRLVTVENEVAIVEITYDADSYLETETSAPSPLAGEGLPTCSSTYAWSPAGRLVSVTTEVDGALEGTRTFDHDTQGRVWMQADSCGGTNTFSWTADDQLNVLERYDGPHASPGLHHDTQHISWQSGGERSSGTGQRGNIPYSGPQHPCRSGRGI